KLLEKELIIISGRNEKAPGQPLLYSTSKNFMDYFGINSAEDLPKLREILQEQTEPTTVNSPLFGGETKSDDPEVLSVTETGELIVNKDADEEA
ncbi:MAG: SMC-Scp complex subunit ScpB, partial [Bacteroidota bacterium]